MRNCWSSRLGSVLFFLILRFDYSVAQLDKQQSDSSLKEKQEYLFPIFPGRANLLAGSMGELRSTHFHAGLDIRTNNMIGIPVRAANKGYVSRIIVGTNGYGKALFITHPDGKQTLYAHLDRFNGALADYVLKEHYARKSFELDLFPEKNLLLVERGDTVALSGNTGGSQGPHLHFEIRDSANQALNPLTFHFDEIVDTYPPHASKIALVTLDSNSRINDKFGRFEFYLLKSGSTFTFSQPILAHGKIGVELLANDRMNNSGFRFGINHIEMRANEKLLFAQSIDKIDFNESKGIQNIFNYKVSKQRGLYFNKLYVDDGNTFQYHEGTFNNGVINVDQKEVAIQVELKDTYGNKSLVKFKLRENPITTQVLVGETLTKPLDFEIYKNIMKVTAKGCKEKSLQIVSSGKAAAQLLSYSSALTNVYLIDLKKTLPDSVMSCGSSLATNLKATVPSDQKFNYRSDFVEINFEEGDLYDTLYLNENYRTSGNAEVFTIGNPLVPLFKPLEVLLKPTRTYQYDKTTAVYSANGANLGGKWENGNIRFYARDLGNFTIQQDLIAPTIYRISLTQRTARFRISDNRSGIASYEATINGDWLLMEYEYKTGILQSVRLDKTKPLTGNFQLKVIDNAGNEKIFQQRIL